MKQRNKWFVFAEEDELLAEHALKEGIYNQACFHSQQGVEKMLKGVLSEADKRIPRTHHLVEILNLLAKTDSSWREFERDCIVLDKYYIPTRYPDALPGTLPNGLPGEKHAREAFEILKRVKAFVNK